MADKSSQMNDDVTEYANSPTSFNVVNITAMLTNLTFNNTGKDGVQSETGQSFWVKLIWCVLFSAVVTVATGGNLIVIWIVLAHRRMRTVTNYLLVNLSIADTMVSTLNITFNFYSMIFQHWPYGKQYCKISNFVAILSISASVFSLMAISIDRYMAIMHPLKPRMSKEATLFIAAFIWIASAALSSPNIFYSTTLKGSNGNPESINCFLIWPDSDLPWSYYDYIYNILVIIIAYVLPITSMTITYSRIGCELWGSQSIGECTNRQLESINSKRRIVKMMIVVVTIFAVCWLPYHIYFILLYHYPAIAKTRYIQHVYLFIYWLAMSNSMYNPLIYCWMNSRFRGGFKKVFRWCPGVKLTDTEMMYEMVPSRAGLKNGSYASTRLFQNRSRNVKCEKMKNNGNPEVTQLSKADV